MGPWQILGEALLAPIKRVDLVVRFFWQWLVFMAAVVVAWSSIIVFAIPHSQSGSQGYEGWDEVSSFAFEWGSLATVVFFLVIVPISIGLTVVGLVRWHRHFSLRETDGGTKADRAGRGLHLLLQWFSIGLAFTAITIAAIVLIGWPILLPVSEASQGLDYVVFRSAVLFTLISFGFALFFKRRSVRLAFVAADMRAYALPKLDRFGIRHRWLTWVLALSLAVPLVTLQVLSDGLYYAFGYREDDVIASILRGGAKEDVATLLPLILSVSLLYFVHLFYPMLVFATAGSLYYREHVRDGLLAALAAETEPVPSPA